MGSENVDWSDRWQQIMAAQPDYNYELQSPMLTRLRQSQSSGLSRTTSLPSADSVLSRAPVGLMSTPEAYSSQPAAPVSAVHSNQCAVRALTHEPSLQKSTSSSSGPDRQASLAEPSPQLDADSVGPLPDSHPSHKRSPTDTGWTFLHKQQPSAEDFLPGDGPQAPESEFRRISSSIGSQSGHYNPAGDIITRLEHLDERGMKAIVFTIEAGQYVALALLLVTMITRSYDPRRETLRHDTLWAINASIAFLCLIVLGTVESILLKRAVHQMRLGKKWSPRRWAQVRYSTIEATSLLVALGLWLGPNMLVLIRRCSWFDPAIPAVEFVIGVCWANIFVCTVMRARSNNLWVNKRGESLGDRPDSICADGPFLRIQWMNVLLWLAAVAAEALVFASWHRSKTFTHPVLLARADCRYSDYACSPSTLSTVAAALRFLVLFIAVAMFSYFLCRTFSQLRNRPYRDYQMANMSARLMIRTRGVAMLVSLLVRLLYSFVDFGSCSSVTAVRMGAAPMFLMWAAIETMTLYWSMPSDVNEEGQILQVWLQEFAWTEEELLSKIKTRGSSLPDSANGLLQEPMFCYETALKAYYFAHLMYSYQSVINDTFMINHNGKPAKAGSEDKSNCMAWQQNNASLEEIAMCQFRTTEKAQECRMRGGAYLPSCKRKQAKRARAALGGEQGGMQQEDARPPLPSLAQSFMCSCCRPKDAVQSNMWSTEQSTHSGTEGGDLRTAGLNRNVPTFKQHIGGCANGTCCCGPSPGDSLAAHRPQRSASQPMDPSKQQSMSRESAASSASAMEEGRAGSHARAEPSGRSQQGTLRVTLAKAASWWPLNQLLPASLVGDAVDAAEAEATTLGNAGEGGGKSWSAWGVGGVSGDPKEARREARHARRNQRIGEAAAAISRPDFEMDAAMAMYNLQHVEAFWERKHDTHALLAWGGDRIVLVFRGTASFANVLADLSAWQVAHLPVRGSYLTGSRPAVHRGFQQSWHASDLSKRITKRVLELVKDRHKEDPTLVKCKVLITGHSLGGALATLAAYDITRAAEEQCPIKVHCMVYTFGAPRVGNHAFARDYRQKVPNTWSVINDQDAVARQAKFLLWYKRAGQRVLINPAGDMLVRPTFVEMSIHNRLYGGSVRQHFLLSYRSSLAAVARAQLDRKKRLHGGLHGVRRVLEQQSARTVLEPAGILLEDIVKLHRWGMSHQQKPAQDPTERSFRVRAPTLPRARKLDEGAAAAAVADADALQLARMLVAPSPQPAQNGHGPLAVETRQEGPAAEGADSAGAEDEEDMVWGGIFEGRCSRAKGKPGRGSTDGRAPEEAQRSADSIV